MDDILYAVKEFFLESRDFNGFPIDGSFLSENKDLLISLIRDNKLEINYGVPHINFHIKALPLPSVDEQVQWIENNQENFESSVACLYPTEQYLKEIISNRRFANRPFSRRLILGEPQLTTVFIDSEVMSQYVYNPLYKVVTDNISGRFYFNGESSIQRPYLPHFGYGIKVEDSVYERCLAIYLYDLHKLPKEEQLIWKRYVLPKNHKFLIHPDYYLGSMGVWEGTKASIFDALVEELKIINEYTETIYGKNMFKSIFEDRPRHYQYMHIPSEVEYYDFVKCLSNMTLDNLNSEFFSSLEIDLTIAGTDENGGVVTRYKGKVSLIEEWLDLIQIPEDESRTEMIQDFRTLYNERSRRSHNECSDVVDKLFYNKQREIMKNTYRAIRLIRLILANHPAVQSISVPEWLYRGEITTY